MYVIEQPLPAAPAANSEANVLLEWNAIYDAYNEVACLILGSMTPELHRQFENSSPYDMIKELKAMFEKQAGVERPTNENAKSKFIQDDIDLGQLRSYIDKHMKEDKVIDLNTDVVVSTNNSYAPEKDNGSKKVSFLEKFLKTREASKNKHHSLSDSEESEVEEVCMPNHISGEGSLDRLEDDLDGYNGYEAQFYDLNEQGQDYAIESAIRILNIVPTKKVDKTPYELWYGKVPNLSYLKDTQMKQWVTISTSHLKTKYLLRGMLSSWRKNLISQEVSGRAVELEEIQDEDTSPSENTSEILMEVEGFEPPQEEVVPVRRSARTHRAPERLCLNVEVEEHSLGDLNEPINYKVVMLDPESNKWLDAMNVEMQSMKDNQVWCLVDLPPNGKTVGGKWLFKKKTNMDGNVHTYKARLVATIPPLNSLVKKTMSTINHTSKHAKYLYPKNSTNTNA
ncbi:retrotransposon protein, putative, ty1-copia subclass [Tanacetum coccineum]